MGINIDISPRHLKNLLAMLHQYLPHTLVWAFGSRVKFTAKPASDLDLVAFVPEKQEAHLSLLKEALAESDLPFKVDLHDWKELPETFQKNIESSFVVLQEAIKEKVPSGWKTCKLGDVINIKHGYAFKGEFFSDIPTQEILLTPGNFKIGGGFKADKIKYYKGKYPADYILRKGDILITMTDLSKAGDTLGYSAKVPEHSGIRYLHNQRLGLVQFKNDMIDPDFLYWVLRTKAYQFYIVGSATGSTVKHTSPKRISSYEFQAPENKTAQIQIASILSSLDDKIELNLQMNQTLEAMAQAIFKEWCYVKEEFIPEGWSWKKLFDIADVSSSKRVFQEEYTVNGIPFYRGKEVTQLSNGESISTELYISNERYLELKHKFGVPQIGDILITSVGTIGSVWLVDNDLPFYFKDGNVTWIKDYKTEINGAFVYQWLQTKEAKDQIKSVTIGSTQQALTISALKGLNILVPDKETVSKVCNQLENINAKKINNLNQIVSLTQLRDTLLPKLMTGKIAIKN